MLIIFDVDGTLLGGESHDWACFDQAIKTVTGFEPTPQFFESLPEITAQAIAVSGIRAANLTLGVGLEERIRDEYLRALCRVHASNSDAFAARDGVLDLLEYLGALPGIGLAIATGDWHPTVSFKLAAAGIDVSPYPMATSSDTIRRCDIIKLAAKRAGRSLSEVVYVGDGTWDYEACRELGVGFVGTGSRPERLRSAGAQHVIEVFERVAFLSIIKAATQAAGL